MCEQWLKPWIEALLLSVLSVSTDLQEKDALGASSVFSFSIKTAPYEAL